MPKVPSILDLAKEEVKAEGLTLEVIDTPADPLHVKAEATKALGKGWSVAGVVEWSKETSLRYAAKLGWTPSPK